LKYKNRIIQISCDGGAATGKSTGAKIIAKKYKLAFLSSGLLYRYAGYLILKYKPKNIDSFLEKKFHQLDYVKLNKIKLHSPKISVFTSTIARKSNIRKILKKFQKDFIKKNKGCVLEGRDASTKIMPNSDLKFFFICNLNVAAKRRYKELKKISKNINLKEVKLALYKRNLSDMTRKISPLQKHPDAVVVDTGKLNKQAMKTKMSKYIERILRKKYGN